MKDPSPDDLTGGYVSALCTAWQAMAAIACHNVPSLLEAIKLAETVGPFADPTLFREKARAMSEDKGLLEAIRPLWELAQTLTPGALLGIKLRAEQGGMGLESEPEPLDAWILRLHLLEAADAALAAVPSRPPEGRAAAVLGHLIARANLTEDQRERVRATAL